MRVPLEWLKEYVDIELSAGELADKLTMIGITAEGIEEMAGDQVLIWSLHLIEATVTVDQSGP